MITCNFIKGDIVTFTSEKLNTGGVIYEVVTIQNPVVPASTEQIVNVNEKEWRADGGSKYGTYDSGHYENVVRQRTIRGSWDENGKKIQPCDVHGFVRIKPLYSFYPTKVGKEPKGKNNTLMIYFDELYRLKNIDLVALGVKYSELGNLLVTIARRGGADV